SGQTRPYTPPHTHDFYEFFYLLDGAVVHTVNGRTEKLGSGALVFIRPDDCHAISGKRFQLINVAFRAEQWRQFCALAELEAGRSLHASVQPPPAIRVRPEQRPECAAAFMRILHAFQHPLRARSERRELCRFWSAALEFLLPGELETRE